jgi:hypothetical protein
MWVRGNKPELDATKVPTAIDIAWSAGIYEGEGCCRLCGGGIGKRGFMVSVGQKDPELLYRLRDWFGGSIRDQGPKYDFRIWSIGGDRARIFMALIYGYMTARRKEQIDAANPFEFLCGESPVGMSVDELKSKMIDFYEDHRKKTWKGNVELSRENSRTHYEANRMNPEWVEKDREWKRDMRANWTEEQREAARQYQREYYQKNKQKQPLNVVEMKKTA